MTKINITVVQWCPNLFSRAGLCA